MSPQGPLGSKCHGQCCMDVSSGRDEEHGSSGNLGEDSGGRALLRPSAEVGIGQSPESLQGGTFANHKLDVTP